jgi:thiamine-monophosphate kinase
VRARLEAAGVGTGARVLLGSGDDAAVIAGGRSAISVDAVVEGVHFRRGQTSLRSVGHKALAAALSDLAAMGAKAGEALVALGLPADLAGGGASELLEGLVAGASEWGVALVGGDVVAAPVLFCSVTVAGPLPEGADGVPRGGARPGQLVAVTGELGGAAAGLLLLDDPASGGGLEGGLANSLRRRQLAPVPRLAAGGALADAGATAMIDVSDGLGADARHVARASGARLVIDLERVPVAPGVEAVARAAGRDPLDLAAGGGEDYELLACIDPAAFDAARAAVRRAGDELTAIGEVRGGEPGVELRGAGGELRDPSGFDQLG